MVDLVNRLFNPESQFQNDYKASHRRKSVLRKEPKILDFNFRRNYNNKLLKLARYDTDTDIKNPAG